MIWSWLILLSAAYCAARAVIDFRERRYAWAVAGLVAAAIILTVPVATHAVPVGPL